jgi:hypothetical protein
MDVNKLKHYAWVAGLVESKNPTEADMFNVKLFARLLLCEAFYYSHMKAAEYEKHFGIKLFASTEE